MVRKFPGLVLAVDQLAADSDVEDSAGALDQFGVDSELLLDRFRQTGGFRVVVSLHAVLDGHLHA